MRKTKTKRPRLEPCPFCSKLEHLEITRPALSFALACYSCGCEGPIANTAAGARRAWNRRAVLADTAGYQRAVREIADFLERQEEHTSGRYVGLYHSVATAISARFGDGSKGDE